VSGSDRTVAPEAELRATARSPGMLGRSIRKHHFYYYLMLPGLVYLFIFKYLPMLGISIAFLEINPFIGFKGVIGGEWIGFKNFQKFFGSYFFGNIVANTFIISGLKLLLSFPTTIILALLINELVNVLFKRVVQTISYLPHFISWVVLGGIMTTFFLRTPDAPFNRLLFALGAIESPTDILNRPSYVWPVFVLSHLWKEVGWSAIIYLAVIASIDAELYEAAEVDGGGRLVKVLNITWPALKGTFMILFILACGQIMAGLGASFDQSYVLGTASNRSMSQILDVYIVRIGLDQGRHSFATAVGLMKNVVNLLLLLSANWLSWRLTGKGLF
jgi:putative aldouronate transport system permease protein